MRDYSSQNWITLQWEVRMNAEGELTIANAIFGQKGIPE
jgi:hypothetical protein